ncbi:MAG: Sir2 family NAD-dependent protein deacetylase [Acidimicrobiia bacterium]|nr:Sir2 family NAD-dependent protein deacetylase [Acidimicrobiia bacterium]
MDIEPHLRDEQAVASLARMIMGSDRILVFTGAGISTGSGIPDYRGPQGVWNTRRPVFYDEFMTSEASRKEYWRQKLEDRAAFGNAEPNAVHLALVRLEHSGKLELLVTQNIDGLHRAAGSDPDRLVEIHGTAALIECQQCGERSEPAAHFATFAESGNPPACHCGGHLKPATISFGQSLRRGDLLRAFTAAERVDLVLALGSTLAVTPAADIPLAAAQAGAAYVIVNRGPTEHDRLALVSLRIEGDVAAVVPAAIEAALGG